MEKKRHIVIDTQVFHSIYTGSDILVTGLEGVAQMAEAGQIELLLPQQIQDEVFRNKVGKWLTAADRKLVDLIKSERNDITRLKREFNGRDFLQAAIDEIEEKIAKLEKERDKLKTKYISPHSKPNKLLKRLFKEAKLIETSDEVVRRAEIRSTKRNPPLDNENHFGDAIIWETLLQFCQKKTNLIIVAYDTGWKMGGVKSKEINKFLYKEWKAKNGGELELYGELTSLLPKPKTKQEITKRTELTQEELKSHSIDLDALLAPLKVKIAETPAEVDELTEFLNGNEPITMASGRVCGLCHKLFDGSIDDMYCKNCNKKYFK